MNHKIAINTAVHYVITDCSSVFKKPIEQIAEKMLKVKKIMDEEIIEKIRMGVLESPLVEREIKKY